MVKTLFIFLDFPIPSNLIPALEWSEVDELVGDDISIMVSGLPTAGIESFYKAEP